MSDTAQGTGPVIVVVRLRDGRTLSARSDGGADLSEIHSRLLEQEFVQIGDDAIVRCAEVLSIHVPRRQASGELPAGEEQEQRGVRELGRQRLLETKPFLLTSEFVLALAAWIALLLTTLATDSIDALAFSVLTAAIAAGYMLSRGFAKANAPSESWDPRDDLVSPGR